VWEAVRVLVRHANPQQLRGFLLSVEPNWNEAGQEAGMDGACVVLDNSTLALILGDAPPESLMSYLCLMLEWTTDVALVNEFVGIVCAESLEATLKVCQALISVTKYFADDRIPFVFEVMEYLLGIADSQQENRINYIVGVLHELLRESFPKEPTIVLCCLRTLGKGCIAHRQFASLVVKSPFPLLVNLLIMPESSDIRDATWNLIKVSLWLCLGFLFRLAQPQNL
jgi:hypothetical protein